MSSSDTDLHCMEVPYRNQSTNQRKISLNHVQWFNYFQPSWFCSHITVKLLTKAHDPRSTFKESVRSITSFKLFCYIAEDVKLCIDILNKKMLLFAGFVNCHQLTWDCGTVKFLTSLAMEYRALEMGFPLKADITGLGCAYSGIKNIWRHAWLLSLKQGELLHVLLSSHARQRAMV